LGGKEVDIEAKRRKITIFENEILSYTWPVLRLRVKCSSGTYIRSIAHDLGQILGCGGYLSGLRRTQVEDFRIEQAKKMEDISEADFLPLDSGLDFQNLELDENTIKRLQFGQRILPRNWRRDIRRGGQCISTICIFKNTFLWRSAG
jgi:tRNA pseudouridine55 synthase